MGDTFSKYFEKQSEENADMMTGGSDDG